MNKAISHLGEAGGPTWSWWNKSVQNWGTGWAWCCAFVNKVFVECGAGNLFYGGGKTASVGIADNWLDSTVLDVKTKYSDADDIFMALIDYIEQSLINDTDFAKDSIVSNYISATRELSILTVSIVGCP